MNKYIKTDIEQALILLKVAVNNALVDIENGNEEEINLGAFVSFDLVVNVAESRGWKENESKDFDTNGWERDCWYYMITPNNKQIVIESCLWKGSPTKIMIDYYNENE